MITNTTQRFWGFIGWIVALFWQDRRTRSWLLALLGILVAGFFLPQNMVIPVSGATVQNWDIKSFWAYPWGSSITHKGIDIFAPKGTDVIASTHGIVVYTHEGGKGGKAVMVLGPKWRFHYYAHLDAYQVSAFEPVRRGEVLGKVGDTGNAKGKPPHLHYAITTPFPYLYNFDGEAVQGWKKMFYLNPDSWLR